MEDKNLAESHPELALEADGWDSSNFTAKMNNVGAWVCALGHRWTAVISIRASKGYGCPFCSGERIFSGFNDLATLYPELAVEADGWDPTKMKPTYSKTLNWRCKEGHIWGSTLNLRLKNPNRGCPYCSNKEVLAGFNDFATLYPELAKQAYGWEPSSVFASHSYNKKWICTLKHVWETSPNLRVRGGQCHYCGGKKVLVGYNDLATTHPLVAAQAHNWDPTTLSAGSDMTREWVGDCGHTWPDTVSHRVFGRGCSLCAGKRVVVGINDFATFYPELAKQAHGWDPTTVTRGSAKPKQWKGLCGHIWTVSPKLRGIGGHNCPYCAGKKVLVGFNDLETTHPELAAEAFEWDPKTLTAGSGHKRAWKGVCGHTWTTAVDFRKRGSGCPACQGQGFNIGKPGWVYVLVGHVRNHVVVQFGISNVPKKRLAKHRLAGFDAVPLALIHFESGADALAEENRLKALQASHGVLTATKTGVIFDGSTEGFVWHESANAFIDVLCDELNINKTVFLKQVAVHTYEASLYDGLIY